jgi:translation initiation factor IF-3
MKEATDTHSAAYSTSNSLENTQIKFNDLVAVSPRWVHPWLKILKLAKFKPSYD